MSRTTQFPQKEMSKPSKKRSLGLSELTLIGLFAGISCGLFFGEGCARFQILGDAFVGLLQMTVLSLFHQSRQKNNKSHPKDRPSNVNN